LPHKLEYLVVHAIPGSIALDDEVPSEQRPLAEEVLADIS
jgi:hypothetical protein